MKTSPTNLRLYLVRHAKSSWDTPGLDDFDRPLNKRGKRNIKEMARWWRDCWTIPVFWVSSPAKRARKTARGLSKRLGIPKNKLRFYDEMYLADTSTLKNLLATIPAKHRQAVFVGHNPGLTEILRHWLGDEAPENLPTTGVAVLSWNVASWEEAAEAPARLSDWMVPKNLPAGYRKSQDDS